MYHAKHHKGLGLGLDIGSHVTNVWLIFSQCLVDFEGSLLARLYVYAAWVISPGIEWTPAIYVQFCQRLTPTPYVFA